MPAPSRPNFVRRLLSFSRQLSSRPSRRGRMCKKTVTTTRWAARKRRRAWRRRRRSAAGVRSAGYRAKCDRGGAAGFWAMSGAATKLPPKKLLQRHAGPSQRAAGQLLLWARTVLGPISRFSHPISLVSPYRGTAGLPACAAAWCGTQQSYRSVYSRSGGYKAAQPRVWHAHCF